MKRIHRTRRREVLELRAALAACKERASVLAHERDRAEERLARLTGEQAVLDAPAAPGPGRPVGLVG